MKKEERWGVVYKITNKLNGKAYVGVTIKALLRRFEEHCKAAEAGSNCKLHRAIRKYGRENFQIRALKKVLESMLFTEEVKFVARHKTFGPGGYNMTPGGDGVFMTPSLRRRISKTMKEHWRPEDLRAAQAVRTTTMWADPNSNIRLSMQSEERSLKVSRASKKRCRTQSGRAVMSELGKLAWTGEGKKEALLTKIAAAKATPESHSKASESHRANWLRPAYRKNQLKKRCSKEHRDSQSAILKRAWQDPEYRANQLAKQAVRDADPLLRKKRSVWMTAYWVTRRAEKESKK